MQGRVWNCVLQSGQAAGHTRDSTPSSVCPAGTQPTSHGRGLRRAGEQVELRHQGRGGAKLNLYLRHSPAAATVQVKQHEGRVYHARGTVRGQQGSSSAQQGQAHVQLAVPAAVHGSRRTRLSLTAACTPLAGQGPSWGWCLHLPLLLPPRRLPAPPLLLPRLLQNCRRPRWPPQ